MTTEGNRVTRLFVCIIAAALLGGACGGRQEIFASEEVQKRAAGAAFDELALPETIPAVPSFVVTGKGTIKPSEVESLSKLDGVALAVPAAIDELKVSSRKGSASLKVATVPVIDFRSVAPAATRSADFVWFALIGGDAVMTPTAAKRIKLNNDTQIAAKGLGKLAVGALADNATPNFADVVLSSDEYPKLGAPSAVIVGAESGVTLNTLAGEIREEIAGAKVTWLLPKTQSVATQQAVAGTTISVPSVAGMHPALAESVARLVSASGGRVWIVSGFRDTARQYQLWVQALEKYGDPEVANNWVAPPGHSYHERGLAVDLGGDLNLAVQIIQEMKLPLWRPMSWEPWHFELAGSRG